MLVYVFFGIIMIFQADGKSEKIVPEIISLVFLCAIIPLLSTGGSYLTNLIISRTKGAMYITTFSLLNSGVAFFGFIQTISYLGIIMAITMSICNKKFVIPLNMSSVAELKPRKRRCTEICIMIPDIMPDSTVRNSILNNSMLSSSTVSNSTDSNSTDSNSRIISNRK